MIYHGAYINSDRGKKDCGKAYSYDYTITKNIVVTDHNNIIVRLIECRHPDRIINKIDGLEIGEVYIRTYTYSVYIDKFIQPCNHENKNVHWINEQYYPADDMYLFTSDATDYIRVIENGISTECHMFSKNGEIAVKYKFIGDGKSINFCWRNKWTYRDQDNYKIDEETIRQLDIKWKICPQTLSEARELIHASDMAREQIEAKPA